MNDPIEINNPDELILSAAPDAVCIPATVKAIEAIVGNKPVDRRHLPLTEAQKNVRRAALVKARAARKGSTELTAKQEAFAKAYAETHNGTQSARIAGYNASPKGLTVIASTNIGKVNIQRRIKEMQAAFVDDSYFMYEKQKALAESTNNEELRNKIYNKILDRAGFMPVSKQQSTTIRANFIVRRGDNDLDGTLLDQD